MCNLVKLHITFISECLFQAWQKNSNGIIALQPFPTKITPSLLWLKEDTCAKFNCNPYMAWRVVCSTGIWCELCVSVISEEIILCSELPLQLKWKFGQIYKFPPGFQETSCSKRCRGHRARWMHTQPKNYNVSCLLCGQPPLHHYPLLESKTRSSDHCRYKWTKWIIYRCLLRVFETLSGVFPPRQSDWS